MFQICPCALVLPLTLAALTLALGKQTLSAAVPTEWNYKITGRTGHGGTGAECSRELDAGLSLVRLRPN